MGETNNSSTTSRGGGDSGYAFKTLWQEITRAVGYAMTAMTDSIGLQESGKTNRKLISEEGMTDRQKNLLDSTKGSSTIPIMVCAIAGACLIIYLLKGKK